MALLLAAALVALVAGLAPRTAQAATSGSLGLAPGKQAVAAVSDPLLDAEGIVTVTVPRERKVWLGLQMRTTDRGDGYRARARIDDDGSVLVGFAKVSNGVETILSSEKTSLQVSTGDRLYVEARVVGQNPVQLSVRAWEPGQAEPGWQDTQTDGSSTQIRSSGKTQVWGYLSSKATTAQRVTFVGASATSADGGTSTPTAGSTSGTKPSAATTGVPSGTKLTRRDGDITVTKDGTVLNGLDIHGFVTVRAKNVKITNSIVRGGVSKGFNLGLITNYGYAGLLIQDVDVVPAHPSVYFDGIKGSNFTARRVHVVGNVDSVKIHGNDVTVEDSLLENTTYYAKDPSQGGGPTHNDNIQILKGDNLTIKGNTIRGATNFAILGGAEQDDVDLTVTGNWLDGGHCTVKLQVKRGWTERAVVTDNRFGPNRAVKSCAFTAYPAVNLASSGNTFELDGSPVPVLRLVS